MKRFIVLLVGLVVTFALAASGSAQTSGTLTLPDSTTVYSGAASSVEVFFVASTTSTTVEPDHGAGLECMHLDALGNLVIERGSGNTLSWSTVLRTGTTTFTCHDQFNVDTAEWGNTATFTVTVIQAAAACGPNFSLTPANGAKADRNGDLYVCTDLSNGGGNGKAVTDNHK